MQIGLKPRVLLVMTAREIGGAELYVERLIQALQNQCHFTVAISDHPLISPLTNRLAQICSVVKLPFDRPAKIFNNMRELSNLAEHHDVIHLNSNHPVSRLGIAIGFLLSIGRTPWLAVEHRATDVNDVKIPAFLRAILPFLFYLSRIKSAAIVAVSKENERTLNKYYHLPSRKLQVVYNGVDVKTIRDVTLNIQRNLHSILVLARLMPSKGHRFLIAAAPIILQSFPDVRFVFVGATDQREEVDKQIDALGLAEKFDILGFRENAIHFLAEADLLVLPSLAEGFSLSIIEALAAGCIVVATSVGGAPEIIQNGTNGYLVPPVNPDLLGKVIIQALSQNAEQKKSMRNMAINTAERFSLQTMADQMFSLYRDILK